MTTLAWKLTPRSGMHLGREGLEQETSAESFSSDSLFAAIIAQTAQMYGDAATEDLLAAFEQDVPPFRLSSLFPIAGTIPLLPRPMLAVQSQPAADASAGDRKKARKLNWVSPQVFTGLLAGKPLPDLMKDGHLLQMGRVLIAKSEASGLPDWLRQKPASMWNDEQHKLWDTGTVPRVTIDRLTNASTIYRVGRTVFAQDCGLWLLAEVERFHDELETLLHHLGDAGIGGERSAGYGSFEIARLDSVPSLKSAAGARQVITLSRVHPLLSELEAGLLEDSAYELVDVGGWMNAPGTAAQKRRRVRMIEAGALLNTRRLPSLRGQVVDVRPQYALPGAPSHPVVRSGIALAVGV